MARCSSSARRLSVTDVLWLNGRSYKFFVHDLLALCFKPKHAKFQRSNATVQGKRFLNLGLNEEK